MLKWYKIAIFTLKSSKSNPYSNPKYFAIFLKQNTMAQIF